MSLREQVDLIKSNTKSRGFNEQFQLLLESNLDFINNKPIIGARHSWHAFPAKFPPQIPKLFIEQLTQKGDTVLDPMMGSCTTLMEAALLERNAIGCDIDHLALINGKAKFQTLELSEALSKGKTIIEKAINRFGNNKKELEQKLNKYFDSETLKFIDFWFLKNTQLELLSILEEIEKIQQENLKSFFKSIFSSIIITKSGGVTLALDLAHTRPHKVLDKKINSAFSEFLKRLNKNLQDYKKLPATKVVLKQANTKKLPLENNSIDLIVTSPPYANNAIDYMRAHKFSLVWFGYTISELKDARKKFIGSENIINDDLKDLPKYSTDKVLHLATLDKKKAKSLHRYYSEMHDALKEMYRVLKPGKACVLVVASSILKGLDVETQKCLGEIGQHVGFELIHIGQRNIDRNRRMLPTSFFRNGSQIESRMHTEYIIGLSKI